MIEGEKINEGPAALPDWAMVSPTGSQNRAGDRYMLNERFYWTMVSQTGSQDRAGDIYCMLIETFYWTMDSG